MYYVVNDRYSFPSSGRWETRKESLAEAKAEAERLAKENPKWTYNIFKLETVWTTNTI